MKQKRYGVIYIIIFILINALSVHEFYREPTEPETRVTAFLEGRVYSTNDDGTTRLWDIRDTTIPSFPYEQVFVPTVVRTVEHQAQGRCQDQTVNGTTTSDCLQAMNFLYSTQGSELEITDQYGAAECQDGFGMMLSWCPTFNEDTYPEYRLTGVLDQNIIVKGQIRDELGDEQRKRNSYKKFRGGRRPKDLLPG